jgi:hypothetical protein
MKVKFTCKSEREKAQSIRTSYFENHNFKKGQVYELHFENGKKAKAYVNREDGSTLKVLPTDLPKGFKLASVGKPVARTINKLKKLK